jgi:hypothetical protein
MSNDGGKCADEGQWPMCNRELREWFSREDISIEELTTMWLHMDQNETTKTEIQRLKDQNNTVELEKRLRQRIQFGTAGTKPPQFHVRGSSG